MKVLDTIVKISSLLKQQHKKQKDLTDLLEIHCNNFTDEAMAIMEIVYINTDIAIFNYNNEPINNDYKTKLEDFKKELKKRIDNILENYFE